MLMADEPIKVLLVYHDAGITPSRKWFDALAAHDQIQLRVLAPQTGYNPTHDRVI